MTGSVAFTLSATTKQGKSLSVFRAWALLKQARINLGKHPYQTKDEISGCLKTYQAKETP